MRESHWHETLIKELYLDMMRLRDFLAAPRAALAATTAKRIGASSVHGRGLLVCFVYSTAFYENML